MIPKHIKKLQSTSRDLRVMSINANTLLVESQSDNVNNHIVTVRFLPNGEVHATCDCEWSQFNGVACSHIMAALEHIASRKGRTLSFWKSEADARRQKHRIFRLTNRTGKTGEAVWITSRED